MRSCTLVVVLLFMVACSTESRRPIAAPDSTSAPRDTIGREDHQEKDKDHHKGKDKKGDHHETQRTH